MKIHRFLPVRLLVILSIAYMAILGGTTSCVSPQSIIYFQGDTASISRAKIQQSYVPVIESNDMLSIVVGSLNQEANAIFNSANEYATTSTSYGSGSSSGRQPFGYLVDRDGK